MLDSHPAIAVPDETKIFDTFLPLLPAYGDLREPARLRRLVADILGWRWIRRLPNPPDVDAVLARVARPELGARVRRGARLLGRGAGQGALGREDAEQPLLLGRDRAVVPAGRDRAHPARRPRCRDLPDQGAVRAQDRPGRRRALGLFRCRGAGAARAGGGGSLRRDPLRGSAGEPSRRRWRRCWH